MDKFIGGDIDHNHTVACAVPAGQPDLYRKLPTDVALGRALALADCTHSSPGIHPAGRPRRLYGESRDYRRSLRGEGASTLGKGRACTQGAIVITSSCLSTRCPASIRTVMPQRSSFGLRRSPS